jgi:RNA polymerase sigma factor (sigma-70 family)
VKKTAAGLFTPRLVASNGSLPGTSPSAADDALRFRQLVLPHLNGAYNLARYLTRDAVLSEDIVQDAFVRAFQGFGRFHGDSPRAWLFAIVRNCCRTAMTRGAEVHSVTVRESDLSPSDASTLTALPDLAPNPEEGTIRNAEIAGLKRAIEAIPEPFREAVVLREMEGLSYAEIAEVTGVAIGTVMSRLSRGRTILADVLLPSRQSDDEASRSVK